MPDRGGDTEAFRRAGHALVDRMADYLAGVRERPVSTPLRPADLDARFAAPLPQSPSDVGEVWDEVWDRVVGDAIHLAHPMYLGHQVAPPLPQAALSEALIGLLNQSVAVWEMSPTTTPVERRVVRWLTELARFPEGAEGTFVSGGSAANLTGLLAARQARYPEGWASGGGAWERGAILVSRHAHYSIERAAGVMGMGTDAVIPAGDGLQMTGPALLAALEHARGAGREPFAVVATAGSTPTGSIDRLAEIARVCSEAGLWLHVDAAHGGSLLLSDSLKGRVAGIEMADSIAWDPHKMMFLPISAGVVLVREGARLATAFRQAAPYLFHEGEEDGPPPDLGTRTLQCSRRADALKAWIALRIHGREGIADRIETVVGTTRTLHRMLEEASDFESCHEPESNILCFRWLPEEPLTKVEMDRLQARIRERYNRSGKGWITSTVLEGRRVLRVTVMNPATGEAELGALLEGLRAEGRALSGRAGASHPHGAVGEVGDRG
jgi:L-2,4-diaminobutyrate decarboxylase